MPPYMTYLTLMMERQRSIMGVGVGSKEQQQYSPYFHSQYFNVSYV